MIGNLYRNRFCHDRLCNRLNHRYVIPEVIGNLRFGQVVDDQIHFDRLDSRRRLLNGGCYRSGDRGAEVDGAVILGGYFGGKGDDFFLERGQSGLERGNFFFNLRKNLFPIIFHNDYICCQQSQN